MIAALRLDIDEWQFRRDLYEMLLSGGRTFQSIIQEAVVAGLSRRIDPLVAGGKCLGYNFTHGTSSHFSSLRSAVDQRGFDFWDLSVQIDMPPGARLSEDAVIEPTVMRWLPVDYGYAGQKTFKFRNLRMKTRERYHVEIIHPFVPSALLSPVLEQLAHDCSCDAKHLVPVPLGAGKWWQQFGCILCGNLYFCDCFESAIVKFRSRALHQKHHYLGQEFLQTVPNAQFKPHICHLCTGRPSELFYIHPMYGTSIQVHYGAYIEKFAVAEDLSSTDAENRVRDLLGVPRLGNGRVNEAQLFKIVRFLLADYDVVREARPKWLGSQRLDIFVPGLSIAVEYQGEQHFRPIEWFGGETGFSEIVTRDERKRKLCKKNGVKLVYFTYKEEITIENVERKIGRLVPKNEKSSLAAKHFMSKCGGGIMQGLTKLMIGPSRHYHQLKSGQIKCQKGEPRDPIWRILIIDEIKNRLHTRAYAARPSADEIDTVVMGFLATNDLHGSGIVVPATVAQLCPSLRERLTDQGFSVYAPSHGFAAGSRVCREVDEFFSFLELSLKAMRESMASCEEIACASGHPLGLVTSKLWSDDEAGGQIWDVATRIAEEITRLRGRDPQIGQRIRDNETNRGPLNRGTHVPAREDVLATLLGIGNHPLRDIFLQLLRIREAGQSRRRDLIAELGTRVVFNQISHLRRGLGACRLSAYIPV